MTGSEIDLPLDFHSGMNTPYALFNSKAFKRLVIEIIII